MENSFRLYEVNRLITINKRLEIVKIIAFEVIITSRKRLEIIMRKKKHLTIF